MVEVNIAALRADIEKYMKTCATYVAKTAADHAVKTASTAIENFYNSYDPEFYIRTWNLHNGSYERYYRNNGKKVSGGIHIGDMNMSEYTTGTWSAAEVAQKAWFGGSHGDYVYSFPIVSTIEMEFGYMYNQWLKQGDSIAKKQNYSIIKFK